MAEKRVTNQPQKAKRAKPTAKTPPDDSPGLPLLKVSMTGPLSDSAPAFTNATDVFKYFPELQQADREHFYVLHLSANNRLLAKELISTGSASASIVHPREVFKGAVLNGSAAVICVHNHPSSDPAPSKEDKAITARLKQASEIMGVGLHDHIIVGSDNYFSFSEAGIMPKEGPAPKIEEADKEKWLEENNYLKVHSFRTCNGNEIEMEVDQIIQRLTLVENLFFNHPNPKEGMKAFDRILLDRAGFEGLGLLIKDACTSAHVLRSALFGDESYMAELLAETAETRLLEIFRQVPSSDQERLIKAVQTTKDILSRVPQKGGTNG